MAVSLVKGQRVNLTKQNPGLKDIAVGLSWDVNKKGFFSKNSKHEFDLDASALMIGKNDKLIDTHDNIVYYGKLKNSNNSVVHSGDNLTGKGSGDDERIFVDLNKIPDNVKKVVFAVTIYRAEDRGQDFGQVNNSFVRLVDRHTNKEILKYNLQDRHSKDSQMIMGELYKHNGEWKFGALGRGLKGSLSDLARHYSQPQEIRYERNNMEQINNNRQNQMAF